MLLASAFIVMKKHKNKIIVGIFIFLALGVFGYSLARSVYIAPTDELKVSPEVEMQITKGQPIPKEFHARLTIPSLGVNARVQNVGITKKGNMGTPNNYTDVGWYKYGPQPGEKGSAVIAGHVDNGLGLAAVFSKLDKIKIGDDVYVEMKEGKTLHFKVTKLDTYDFNAKADEVFTQKDETYLKLITCTGVWVPKYKTHNKRLVVTTVLVD
jgi:LPXTG-site transpeptidase (sortase) family protein